MIRPIEMQMLIPRTESVANTHQHEIQHGMNVNANAANEVVKEEQRLSETVVSKEEKEFDTYQYDAKEEGNGKYSGKRGKKKKPSSKETKNASVSNVSESDSSYDKGDFQPRVNIQI